MKMKCKNGNLASCWERVGGKFYTSFEDFSVSCSWKNDRKTSCAVEQCIFMVVYVLNHEYQLYLYVYQLVG